MAIRVLAWFDLCQALADLESSLEVLITQDLCAATCKLELEKNQILPIGWFLRSYSGQLLVLRQGKRGFVTVEVVTGVGRGGEVFENGLEVELN